MTNSWIFEIENKFAGIKIMSYIIMPNHIHAIITNTPTTIEPTDAPVGADLRVCPPVRSGKNKIQPNATDDYKNTPTAISSCNADTHQGEHVGSPLHRVVQWFKTMTTNEYIRCVKSMGWKPFDRKLWQRNNHELMIRNEHSLNQIKIYIENNPKKWEEDKLYYPNQNGDAHN
jgi:REP element-mobilizing transposase RayT